MALAPGRSGRDDYGVEPGEPRAAQAEDASASGLGLSHASLRSPPVLILVAGEEEEVEFCAPDGQAASPADLADDPPFDPPDLEELRRAASEDEDCALALNDLLGPDHEDDDEEPPFDPIDAEELAAPSLSAAPLDELVLTPANENGKGALLGPVRDTPSDGAYAPPAPAIRIYFSWDQPRAAEFFQSVAADPRLARTETTITRGGLDGAAVFCAAHERPHLVVVDTTLRGSALLDSLDRLVEFAGKETKIIVIGAVNDVTLLREMEHRGVDQYLIWPVKPEEIAGSACALFASVDKARVIAVIGARGGLGASTIAHNLAWCIAERQRAGTTLVDLDMSFGTAAFDFKVGPRRSLADAFAANAAANDVALERVGATRGERLTILAAPATPHCTSDVDPNDVQDLIAAARRLSSFVVLDLPHLWAPWVKQALFAADEIVLVSSPDIASLRNTDNIAKLIKSERKTDPIVVLSMAGVPKRPEVPFKEFAEALGITPACTFAFEPNIFGAASLSGLMLGEIAPGAKAVVSFDQLATLLTGRHSVEAPNAGPRIFEGPLPSLPTPEELDPFAHALVNPFALLAPDDLPEDSEPAPGELAPLELLQPAPVEPAYIGRARAAALEDLHTIETSRREPERRFALNPVMSAVAGFAITALAVGAFFFMRMEAAPAPAAALVTAPVRATSPPPRPAPSTPEQMAGTYQAALQLIEQNAPQDALATMQRLANAGFVIAQYRLAKMYERGEGMPADLVQARVWTERAAAGGNRNAMHDLGAYYAQGEGAPRDYAAARRLFQQAAELGFVDSQFNLGVLYQEGRGVEANVMEALFWFRLAASHGDQAGAERASEIELGLTAYDMQEVDSRVAAFQPRVANPIANGEFLPAQAPTGPPRSHVVGSIPNILPSDDTPR